MDFANLVESIFRWLHVVFGIMWVGVLYFFNFVNGPFEGTLDNETKQKVVPELRPRALFWFRLGAAMTWVTGVLLLFAVFYHGGQLFGPDGRWGVGAFLMIALTFTAPFIYDALVTSVLKELQAAFVGGLILTLVVLLLFDHVGGFSVRGYAIHLGSMFGTIMAFNVWFRIWPSQQKIIAAIKSGGAPDAALVALAGTRSKHNTYLSVPLVFMMLSQHAVGWATNPLWLALVVLAGWGLVYHLYSRAAAVKGW